MNKLKNIGIFVFVLCIAFCFVLGNDVAVKAATPKTDELMMILGETYSLNVDGEEVSYYSSDRKVVKVNKKGMITALKKGKATIKAVDGKATYKWSVTVTNKVDLIIFAGQSNMAGQGGTASGAPSLLQGAGYECKAVTNPSEIVPIQEPFGLGQDTPLMNDAPYRNGTLVTSFVNAYYNETGVPVVGVSVTKVGTTSDEWNQAYYEEIILRYKRATAALKERGIKVRKRYLVFLQGESDALIRNTSKTYRNNTLEMFRKVKSKTKIEKCLLIRIGTYHVDKDLFDDILNMQTKICKNYQDFVLISTKASALSAGNYMPDGLHMTQNGLNIVGKEAGKYAGRYTNTGKEPNIKDKKNGVVYKARKIQKY